MTHTLTIISEDIAALEKLAASAKAFGAATTLSQTFPHQHITGIITDINHFTSPKTITTSAPCLCSGQYIHFCDGIIRQAIPGEGSGPYNTKHHRLEAPPFQDKETIIITGSDHPFRVYSQTLTRYQGRHAWQVHIEKQ